MVYFVTYQDSSANSLFCNILELFRKKLKKKTVTNFYANKERLFNTKERI